MHVTEAVRDSSAQGRFPQFLVKSNTVVFSFKYGLLAVFCDFLHYFPSMLMHNCHNFFACAKIVHIRCSTIYYRNSCCTSMKITKNVCSRAQHIFVGSIVYFVVYVVLSCLYHTNTCDAAKYCIHKKQIIIIMHLSLQHIYV